MQGSPRLRDLAPPALLIACWMSTPALADSLVIHCGQLLDVVAGEMRAAGR